MNHLIGGLAAFLERYVQVWRSAWGARHELDPPTRTAQEREFLPAQLELIQTPASPTARWTMRIIITFFCLALLWACLGRMEIVAVAPGKTVVSSRTKILQPMETAVVRRILVRDGQSVARGDLLIELDATLIQADHERVQESLINARLAQLRHEALVAGVTTGGLPPLSAQEGVPEARWRSEYRLAQRQFEAFQARRQGLQARIAQRQAELETIRGLIQPLSESAQIARARAVDYQQLLADRFIGRHDYLQLEQQRITAESDLATQYHRLEEIRSALLGAQEELQVLIFDTHQQSLDGLRQATEQIAQLTPELTKTQQRDQLTQLRSPVDGTVQQLAVHTVGGVVTAAQPLLAVVPSGEPLEIEAMILNKDIGFVRVGQSVTVKIESFPYTRYGYLTGAVVSVSHDAAQDERLGLVFPARVALDSGELTVDGVRLRLTPGMNLTAEIRTGDRRVIDYLLSPLKKQVGEAMREQ